MQYMTELHHFENFSISRSAGGDYYAELDTGQEVLLLSPNGSDEHAEMANFYESSDCTEEDFDYDALVAESEAEGEEG